MPRYLELVNRIANGDERVQWTKMTKKGDLSHAPFWQARASKKLRLFTTSRILPMEIIGFAAKGERGVWRFEW